LSDQVELQREAAYIGIDIGISNIAIYSDKGLRYVGRSIVSSDKTSSESDLAHVTEPVISLLSGDSKALEHVRDLLKKYIDNAKLAQPAENSYALLTVDHNSSGSYKRNILEIANDLFKGAMVVDSLFCVAYRSGKSDPSIYVDIGTSSTRICCINGDVPESMSCMSIDSGGNDIEKELLDLVSAEHEEILLTDELVKEWVNSYSYVGEFDTEAKVKVPYGGSNSGDEPKPDNNANTEFNITEEMALASEYLVSDVISGLTRMISDIDPELRDVFRSNIYLCGVGSKIRNISSFMEDELKELGGGKVFLVDDPVFAGAIGAWMLAAKMPMDFWAQLEEQKNTKRKV